MKKKYLHPYCLPSYTYTFRLPQEVFFFKSFVLENWRIRDLDWMCRTKGFGTFFNLSPSSPRITDALLLMYLFFAVDVPASLFILVRDSVTIEKNQSRLFSTIFTYWRTLYACPHVGGSHKMCFSYLSRYSLSQETE